MRKLLAALALIFSMTLSSWGAITITQHAKGSSSANSTDVAVTVSSTASKVLVVGTVRNGSTDTVSSVADNIGNTYVHATSSKAVFGAVTSDIWYCLNATSGVTTVTVHWGVTATTNKLAEVWEVAGFTTPVFDLANNGSNDGAANVITGASVTTTSTIGFIAAIVGDGNSDITQNPNAGNEFTSGGDIVDGTNFVGATSLISVTAAAHNSAWHTTSAAPHEVNSIAAFKESAVKSVASPFVIAP